MAGMRSGGAAWAGLVGNLALAALKVAVGIIGRSQALLADGLHSAADVVGSVAVLVGLHVAQAPADPGHPYGHEKAESVASLVVALFLGFAGVEVAARSVEGLLAGVRTAPAWVTLWVAIGAAAAKVLLYRYTQSAGRRFASEALVTEAQEHRADIFSSLAAVVGITGARLGVPQLDPVAGIVVAGFIIRWGWDLTASAVQDLIDAGGDPGMLADIVRSAGEVAGVGRVEVVKTRRMGARLLVDVEIGVEGTRSLAQAHDIAERVRSRLCAAYPAVKDVMVHVNPLDR